MSSIEGIDTVAMQTRCLCCGMEQYAPAVWTVSHGVAACTWCGEFAVPMEEEEYLMRLADLRQKQRDERQ